MTVVTTLTLADLLDEAGLTGRGGGASPPARSCGPLAPPTPS